MAIALAPQYTQRNYRWTEWKAVNLSRSLFYQYEDDGVVYTIWGYDGPEVHVTQIWKNEVPYTLIGTYDQPQNDSDKTDFETNYLPFANRTFEIKSTEVRAAYLVTSSTTRSALRATAYTEQMNNAQRSFVSTSASDTAAGTGARRVKLYYYDNNVNGPYVEEVILNGTVAVNTVATNICLIEKIEVTEVGGNGSTVGTVRLNTQAAGAGATFASIAAGDNRTFFAHHYIPNGRTMYLTSICASADQVNYQIESQKKPLALSVGTTLYASIRLAGTLTVRSGSPSLIYTLDTPFIVTGPSRFELMAKSDSLVLTGTVYADFTYYER